MKFNITDIQSIPISDIKLISEGDELGVIVELYKKYSITKETQKDQYLYECLTDLLKSKYHFYGEYIQLRMFGALRYKNEMSNFLHREKYAERNFYSFLLMIESTEEFEKFLDDSFNLGTGSSYDQEEWDEWSFVNSHKRELINKFNEIKEKLLSLINNSVIMESNIYDQFSLNNPDNKFKLIYYTWNGGDDFNYNIFNKEPLPEGEYIGSPSSSELTISVNDTTLYIKHYNIQDGPIPEDFYLGISQSPNYDNIEWFKRISRDNPELIDIIFILCMGLRDEDFVYEYGEFDYYEEPGHKYEVNIEIDVNALKDMWDEF